MTAMLALLLQAAVPSAAPPAAPPTAPEAAPEASAGPVGERFSILTDPCASARNDGGDVVVCGHAQNIAPRLPLPRFRGPPDHPVPSNPDMKASVALDGPGVGDVCGAYGENCPIAGGGSGYVSPLTVAAAAVNGVKNAFATRRYRNKGEAIPMTDAPLDTRGKVLP